MLRPERWQMYLAGILVVGMVGILTLLQPESTRQESLRATWKQQQALKAARWQSVIPLQTALAMETEKTGDASKPFSPVDFQRPDAELVSWTPAAQGGEMVLEIAWSQVPPLFAQLAESGMRITAFSINAGATRHTLTLQLEGPDGH